MKFEHEAIENKEPITSQGRQTKEPNIYREDGLRDLVEIDCNSQQEVQSHCNIFRQGGTELID